MCLFSLVLHRHCGHVACYLKSECGAIRERDLFSDRCDNSFRVYRRVYNGLCNYCAGWAPLHATSVIRKLAESLLPAAAVTTSGIRGLTDVDWMARWYEEGWKTDLALLKAVKRNYHLQDWREAQEQFPVVAKFYQGLDVVKLPTVKVRSSTEVVKRRLPMEWFGKVLEKRKKGPLMDSDTIEKEEIPLAPLSTTPTSPNISLPLVGSPADFRLQEDVGSVSCSIVRGDRKGKASEIRQHSPIPNENARITLPDALKNPPGPAGIPYLPSSTGASSISGDDNNSDREETGSQSSTGTVIHSKRKKRSRKLC